MRALLSDPEAGPDELIFWLQGLHLPPLGGDDEAYLWLLRGLPLGAERHRAEKALAGWAAEILQRRPDVEPLGEEPEELLGNLLMLSAALAYPDQLAEPLLAVYQRRALAGEWLGLPLTDALMAALARNQLDARLKPVWLRMLREREKDFLGGSPYDGFEGVLWMPPSAERRGEPALEAIGQALGDMARYLEGSERKEAEFCELIQRAYDAYPGRPWGRDFVRQAHRWRWAPWTLEWCLPPVNEDPQRPERVLVEQGVLAIIPRSDRWRVRKRLCSGGVLEVDVPPADKDLLERIGWRIEAAMETARRTARSTSARMKQVMLQHTLAEIEGGLRRAERGEDAELVKERLAVLLRGLDLKCPRDSGAR